MKRWVGFVSRLRCALLVVFAAAAVGGCGAQLIARNPLPNAAAQLNAQVAGLPGVRFWADETPTDPVQAFRMVMADLPQLGTHAARINGRPVVEILALSGGGGDGAFGAGVLTGWTARGDRPKFEIVTGVSAGAIIAPFAFLGSRYDGVLKEIWTTYRTADLGTVQGLQGILGGDALVETSGLAQLIARYATARMLAEIGREYERGRVLLVLTTNLDAQRPVVWNLGALARSGHPEALQLFHKIILASAAIPGAFSPVRIKVVADGQVYDELHVDGGTTREIFISPAEVPLKRFDGLYDRPPIRRIYLIKNGRAHPVFTAVEQKTLPIAGRAITTLILNQSLSDVYRIYRRANDAGAEFNFAAIPPEFPYIAAEVFDPAYQSKLFDYGANLVRTPGFWQKVPPDVAARPRAASLVQLRTVERPKEPVNSPDFSWGNTGTSVLNGN